MVKVDKEKCIGCGLCPEVCDRAFEMDSEGKAQVKKGLENAEGSDIEDAIECCPVDAISK